MTIDSPLTGGELQAIADRQKFRNTLALFATVLQVVGTVAFVIIAIVLLGSANQQQRLSQRADCKTSYASILGAPVIQRDDFQAQVSELSGSLESQLGAALLSGQRGGQVTQAQVTQFAQTKNELDVRRAQLEQSIATVMKLPSLATATNKGFSLNGVHHPACPTVG